MSIRILEKLKEGENYKIIDKLHLELGKLIEILVNQGGKGICDINTETITEAILAYQEYIKIDGDSSNQYIPNLN